MKEYNPFDQGVQKAIQRARENLSATDPQKHQAINQALRSFANNYAKQPIRKGFVANLGSIGKALNPALTEYDNIENEALKENKALAKDILDRELTQEKLEREAEDIAWNRAFKEKQFEEQKRAHNLLYNFRKDKDNSDSVNIDGETYNKLDKIEQRQARKEKKEIGSVKLELDKVIDQYGKLKNKTKDNVFSPTGGWSKVVNPIKDVVGQYLDLPGLQEETAYRKDLFANLQKIIIPIERAKKGGGVLGQGMYERLKTLFPNESDDTKTLEEKLISLKNETDHFYKAAKARSSSGLDIDPIDLKEEHENIDFGVKAPNEAGWIKMIDPKRPDKIIEVHPEDIDYVTSEKGYQLAK